MPHEKKSTIVRAEIKFKANTTTEIAEFPYEIKLIVSYKTFMNSFTQSWIRFKGRQLLSSSKIVQSSSLLKQACSKLFLKEDFQGQTNSYFEMEFII